MFSLLLLSSLLHITTCTVYTVTPDDHYYPNTTCHHCHNLQHYLLNVTKYFTSNTQLLFLPGLHHLHTDLIIQNVHNISLIGSTANGTTSEMVIIRMHAQATCITITNVTTLVIRSLIIEIQTQWASININNCFWISLDYLQIKTNQPYERDGHFALECINIMGSSYFNDITLPRFGDIKLFYNETHRNLDKQHILTLDNCRVRSITIDMLQNSYKLTLKIANMQATAHNGDPIISTKELGTNEVLIINCQFISISFNIHLFSFISSSNGSVKFINCQFENNKDDISFYFMVASTWPWKKMNPSLIKLDSSVGIELNNCSFYADNTQTAAILRMYDSNRTSVSTKVVIKNTSFTLYSIAKRFSGSDITYTTSFITLSHTNLQLEGLVVFRNITTPHSIISLNGNSRVIISGSAEFSHNNVHELINFYENDIKYITMRENSVINIANNEVWKLFAIKPIMERYPYPYCLFQYSSNSTIIIDSKMTVKNRNFLIRFYNNHCKQEHHSSCFDYIPITSCQWLPQSSLNYTMPLEVNSHYMQFLNNSGTYKLSQIIEQSSLCVCTNELHYDCHITDLGYLYPGQTLITFLHHKRTGNSNTATAVAVKTDIDQPYISPCVVLNVSENIQSVVTGRGCNKLCYTIGFPTKSYCELFLKIVTDSDVYLNVFYVQQIICPNGFIKIDKRCQCDPVLVQCGITNCNINDQTILRPANSWISSITHNNSYTYHISLHCPFHYCLPHSSRLNFSTPNSQCQFNRSGLLCGQCQQGLSTVFSSSSCQQCSSTFLLLIIPIAVTGLVLVLMLFALNLTVTDGIINGFILYVNIISIDTPLIFTEVNHFSPTYTFISLANLDLGIQTCFYNGMDDYAKMWLQLAFPFYLIFIATLIIITSRYSITIQRLTARRALPVLATLFLLSYTKILRIVSSVLFFYSTITHLPSKHTTLVWSVDANVPLFGVRFTILFIVCLILFLILVPFNVILLFTRTLSRFRFINKFKPLLDAYQGPYKNTFYYWTGLQLLIRTVFFGISSLDRNINIAISILILSVIIGSQGAMQPFKVKHKNYQEMLLFFNLHGLYVSLLYSQDNANSTTINVAITLAALHFSFIIVYHMITYVYGGVIRNRIQLSINTLTGWIIGLKNRTRTQQFQLQDNVRDNIPEVAFNYHEYREPLVGVDY